MSMRAENDGPWKYRWSRFHCRLLNLMVFSSVCVGVWSDDAPNQLLVSQPRNGPELLELHGIDASQLSRIVDGESVGSGDHELIVKMLYEFPRFSLAKLETWGRANPLKLDTLPLSTTAVRGSVVSLRGNVVGIEAVAILPELARRIEFDRFFQVTIRPEGHAGEVTACVRQLPRQWSDPETWTDIFERNSTVEVLGYLIKRTTVDGEPGAAVVAGGVAWFPNTEDSTVQVTTSAVSLAAAGMDVGLLAELPDSNGQPILRRDTEAFYRLLGVWMRASGNAGLIGQSSWSTLNIGELLSRPAQHHGELLTFPATARRVLRIAIEDEDSRQRFGLDHYFQIDAFVPLDNQIIRLGKDEDSPTFNNSFPVTICVPSLPDGMSVSDLTRQDIIVHASFFKLWSYQSEFVSQKGKAARQLSPMFIGLPPQIAEEESSITGFGSVLALLFVIALAATWLGMNRFGGSSPKPRLPFGDRLSR